MEANETILLEVKIDEGETEARVKELNAQLKFFRDAVKGLAKDLKDGLVSQKQYDESVGRADDQIKKLNTELGIQKKALDDTKKGIVANSGSLNEMRAKADAAKQEYMMLTAAERDNDKIGGVLLKRYHDLNKASDDSSEKLNNANKSVSDYIKSIDILGINIGETVSSFKEGGIGIKTFSGAIFSSRGALIALTAVPIVAVLTGLYLILTKSQAGMDYLARKTAGFTAILQQLTNIVIDVGGKIYKAFEEGRLGALILDGVIQNLVNRFTGLKVIAEGVVNLNWRKIVDGFIQTGTGITDATSKTEAFSSELNKARKAAEGVALESQKIRDKEIELNVERAKGRAEIEKQKKISEDTTKSTNERANAAQKAYDLEDSLLKKSIDLQERKIANIKAELKPTKDLVESKKVIGEEEIKLAELVEESTGKQTELQNNLNSIRKEGADKALADQKKVADEEIAYWERILIQAKKSGSDTEKIEEQIIRQRAKAASIDSSSTDKKGVQERLLIWAKAEADILALRVQYALDAQAKVNRIEASGIDSSLALAQRGSKEELDLTIARIRAQGQAEGLENERQLQGQENRIEREVKSGEIVIKTQKAIDDARMDFSKADVNRQADIAAQRLQTEIDLGDQSLAQERDVASKRIDLEEDTQKKLLEVDLQYNQISNADYLVRRNAIQAKALAAHRELNRQIADADRTNDLAILDAKLISIRDGSKAQLSIIQEQLAIERKQKIDAAKGDKKAIEAIEIDYNNKTKEAQKKYNKSLFDQIVEEANQATATLSSIVDAQVASQTAALDQQHDAETSNAALTADARAKIDADYQKKKDAIDFAANEKRKKIATAQNIINGAVAVVKAFADLGPIGGLIASALIAAQVVAQQIVIDNQKFASGGIYQSDGRGSYVKGPGTGTSDSINARISNGEAVINAKSTARFYPVLSAINQAEGGRAFPGLGSQVLFDTKHALPAYSMGGVQMASVDSDAIADAVERGIARANIRVGVDEVTKKQASVKYAEVSADYTYSKRS